MVFGGYQANIVIILNNGELQKIFYSYRLKQHKFLTI